RLELDRDVAAHIDGDHVRLTVAGRCVWLTTAAGPADLDVSLEAGWVSPSYGVKVPTVVVTWRATAARSFEISFLFAEARLDGHVRREAVDRLAGASPSAHHVGVS